MPYNDDSTTTTTQGAESVIKIIMHQNPYYSRIEAPAGGYVIAASLASTPWKDAVRLTCETAGPLLLSYVKTEWYRRPKNAGHPRGYATTGQKI